MKCETCKGTGEVERGCDWECQPRIRLPTCKLCLGIVDCPDCDGTGEKAARVVEKQFRDVAPGMRAAELTADETDCDRIVVVPVDQEDAAIEIDEALQDLMVGLAEAIGDLARDEEVDDEV